VANPSAIPQMIEDPAHAAAPAIILVEPQLGENIGSTARAMLNCGLLDLRLVRPRDGWPNPAAIAMASGATAVLDAVRVYDDLASAAADLHRLYATTARHRDMVKHEVTPRHLAEEIHSYAAQGARSGILFGRERTGLENDEVAACHAVVVVPLNPAFTSLNLAQAVLLITYEWYQAQAQAPPRVLTTSDSYPALQADHQAFLDRLERSLEGHGYFRTPDLRPAIWRKIVNLLNRADLTEGDIRILHGMLSAFEGRHGPRSSSED
jgi:tRNA/rRNA methyltransferase